jgi:ParB/RepB/Spo0J family partition protein
METTAEVKTEVAEGVELVRLIRGEMIDFDENQPRKRKDPEMIRRLAESISGIGLLHPPLVRPRGNRRYEVVVGECRVTACRDVLGWKVIPCIVKEILEEDIIWAQLAENDRRNSLTTIELGRVMRWLIEEGRVPSQKDLCTRLNRTPAYVSQHISIVKKLNTEICDMLLAGEDAGAGGAITGLNGLRHLTRLKRKEQAIVYREAVENDWTTEEIAHRVDQILAEGSGLASPGKESPVPIRTDDGGEPPTANDASDTVIQNDSEPANGERGESYEPEVSHPAPWPVSAVAKPDGQSIRHLEIGDGSRDVRIDRTAQRLEISIPWPPVGDYREVVQVCVERLLVLFGTATGEAGFRIADGYRPAKLEGNCVTFQRGEGAPIDLADYVHDILDFDGHESGEEVVQETDRSSNGESMP